MKYSLEYSSWPIYRLLTWYFTVNLISVITWMGKESGTER